MQRNPEKVSQNYNEVYGSRPSAPNQLGILDIVASEEHVSTDPELIVQTGVVLVNNKVKEILGADNHLTKLGLAYPKVHFIASSPDHPNWAGYFSSTYNEIGIMTDKVYDTVGQIKVFVHEYIHFLSHNGRDDTERLSNDSPVTEKNNVGFRRHYGLDIRKGCEGQTTSDYFLSWNEATTELLATEIVPEGYKTYQGYVGLLNQVMDDAVAQKMGTRAQNGLIHEWSRDQFKTHVYSLFLKGDLAGFTSFLKNVYSKYDISEQQFGLMTNMRDLPSIIESELTTPNNPTPSPASVAARVQHKLDYKTPEDYVTDVVDPEPYDGGDDDDHIKYGTEYDKYVQQNQIAYSHSVVKGAKTYKLDNGSYIIYKGEESAGILQTITEELHVMLEQDISSKIIADRMQELLFSTYRMSMLSDGFRDFYIYKHSQLDD